MAAWLGDSASPRGPRDTPMSQIGGCRSPTTSDPTTPPSRRGDEVGTDENDNSLPDRTKLHWKALLVLGHPGTDCRDQCDPMTLEKHGLIDERDRQRRRLAFTIDTIDQITSLPSSDPSALVLELMHQRQGAAETRWGVLCEEVARRKRERTRHGPPSSPSVSPSVSPTTSDPTVSPSVSPTSTPSASPTTSVSATSSDPTTSPGRAAQRDAPSAVRDCLGFYTMDWSAGSDRRRRQRQGHDEHGFTLW